jgi:hypothetical protein
MNEKPFPLIAELPALLVANEWCWEPCSFRGECVIGIDPESRRWLVQIRGSQRAYQEHVFARLAQHLGISCQSSVLLQIPSSNFPPLDDTLNNDTSQLAIWLMEEHDSGNCAASCLFKDGLAKSTASESDLLQWLNSGLPHVVDLVKGDLLGYLCGGAEKPDRFWTADHQYVVIDNERMFECEPNLSACPWMDWSTGRNLAKELLECLASIPDEELCRMAELPSGYVVSPHLCLKTRLLQIKKLAAMEHFELDAVIEEIIC